MSIPHLLTAAGTSAQSTLPPPPPSINSRHFSAASASNSKEHIRERLNMHVKKRIHGQDIIPHPQYSLPAAAAAAAAAAASSTVYSATPLSSALKPTHPFLMSNASVTMPPMVVFANSLITVTSDYNNGMGRTIPLPQIDHRPPFKPKLQQPKKMTKKKKTTTPTAIHKKFNAKPMNHQAENLILNSTKYSDDSNDYAERNEMGGSSSPTQNHHPSNGGDTSPPPYEKPDQRSNNSPDILSMVLSLKKNALMHDPYVIQFISSIR